MSSVPPPPRRHRHQLRLCRHGYHSPDLDGVDSVGLETAEPGLCDGAVDLLPARRLPGRQSVGFVENGVALDGRLVVGRGNPGEVGRPAGVVQDHQLGNLVRHVLNNTVRTSLRRETFYNRSERERERE